MQARMKNPAMVLDAMSAIGGLYKAMHRGGVPELTLELVHLRASQINGCAPCIEQGNRGSVKAGATEEKLWTLSAWREAPYFTDAERAALALTEAATRIADRTGDAVPDDVWDEAADHFDEKGLSAIIMMIATTNFFNRLNIPIKEPAGTTWA